MSMLTRRLFLFLTFIILLSAAGMSRVTAEDAEVTRGDIFPLQDKHVHSSSLVAFPNGDIFACWYHGSGERRANDVVIQASLFHRGKWSRPELIADTPDLPDCNPVLFTDNQNRLWMFWIVPVANRWENSLLQFRRAEIPNAPGQFPDWNWQGSIILKPGASFVNDLKEGFKKLNFQASMWAEYALPYTRLLAEAAEDPTKRQMGWMPRTRPIITESGRFILPLYSDGFNVSLMGVSDDLGETWKASRPIVGLGPIQPAIMEVDGEIHAWMRDSGAPPGRILFARSRDDGSSWSVARDTAIPNSGSSVEVLKLKSGRCLLVGSIQESGRNSLSVLGCLKPNSPWQWDLPIESSQSPGDKFSYPALIQTPDGVVHLTYSVATSRGETIRHAQFTPNSLFHSSRKSQDFPYDSGH